MEKILIIKTGAAGDVVRTTSLLNVLGGSIYWVTSAENKPLFRDDQANFAAFTVEEAFESLSNLSFAHIISLEEDHDCARLASEIKAKQITGVYLDQGRIQYTENSAYWFDMSRVSKLGLKKANQLKAENLLSYQDCIFNMLGKKFKGEPYCIYDPTIDETDVRPIGIEKRAGGQWPDKQWWGYDTLIRRLGEESYPVRVFKQRLELRDYLADIAGCRHIVSGDSLAMHIALAYHKPCTAIFNCTSPQEIYDYGLLKKRVSPLLHKYFYANTYDQEAIESVSLEEVYQTLFL